MLKGLETEVENARQFVESLARTIDRDIEVKTTNGDGMCTGGLDLSLQKGDKVRRVRVTAIEVLNARNDPRDLMELLRSAWHSRYEYASDAI